MSIFSSSLFYKHSVLRSVMVWMRSEGEKKNIGGAERKCESRCEAGGNRVTEFSSWWAPSLLLVLGKEARYFFGFSWLKYFFGMVSKGGSSRRGEKSTGELCSFFLFLSLCFLSSSIFFDTLIIKKILRVKMVRVWFYWCSLVCYLLSHLLSGSQESCFTLPNKKNCSQVLLTKMHSCHFVCCLLKDSNYFLGTWENDPVK